MDNRAVIAGELDIDPAAGLPGQESGMVLDTHVLPAAEGPAHQT